MDKATEIKQSVQQGRERWETLNLDQLDQEIDKIQQRYMMAAASFHSSATLDQLQSMIQELSVMRDEKIDTQAYLEYTKQFPQTIDLDQIPEKLTNKIDTSKLTTFANRYTWEKRSQSSDGQQQSSFRPSRQPTHDQGSSSGSSGEPTGGRFTPADQASGKRHG